MSEETQALCFLAGANSIFYGPKLLTTPNPGRDRDMALLDKLGLRPMERVSRWTRLPVIVFLGGGIGAALRHGVNLLSARLFGTAFPWHTLIENVTGSLVMGLLAGYFAFKGRCLAALAAVPHHRHPRRLHHVLGVLARRRAALRARRNRRWPRSMCWPRWCWRSAACSPGWRWCGISPEAGLGGRRNPMTMLLSDPTPLITVPGHSGGDDRARGRRRSAGPRAARRRPDASSRSRCARRPRSTRCAPSSPRCPT